MAHAWLVDALARTLEIRRLEDRHWVIAGIHAEAEEIRAEPFDSTVLPLARLWLD